jgi:hypothetical protein
MQKSSIVQCSSGWKPWRRRTRALFRIILLWFSFNHICYSFRQIGRQRPFWSWNRSASRPRRADVALIVQCDLRQSGILLRGWATAQLSAQRHRGAVGISPSILLLIDGPWAVCEICSRKCLSPRSNPLHFQRLLAEVKLTGAALGGLSCLVSSDIIIRQGMRYLLVRIFPGMGILPLTV